MRHRFSVTLKSMCPLLFLPLLLGCGNDGRPPLAKVTGTVSYKGKPLVGANICFLPEQPGIRSALGTTDQTGRYSLLTYDPDDGAPVGKHKVVISLRGPPEKPKLDPALKAKYGEAYFEQLSGLGKLLIPEKYNSPESSGLSVDVVAGRRNVFDFDLQGEPPGKAGK